MSETENAHPARIVLDRDGSAAAPIVYFDGAASSGIGNGIANITLEAVRYYGEPVPNHVDRVVVTHLRTSIEGLRSLKMAVDNALFLAEPPASEASN